MMLANIEPIEDADIPALLALNNANAAMLSWLDRDRMEKMLRKSAFARQVGPGKALIVVFDQDSGYDGLYFAWFKQRYERFLYVDRVVVDRSFARSGIGQALYQELFAYARSMHHEVIGCEVYRTPANPVSDAFHAAFGFVEAGQHETDGEVKARYLVRHIA